MTTSNSGRPLWNQLLDALFYDTMIAKGKTSTVVPKGWTNLFTGKAQLCSLSLN